jgi:hypothetical protein
VIPLPFACSVTGLKALIVTPKVMGRKKGFESSYADRIHIANAVKIAKRLAQEKLYQSSA